MANSNLLAEARPPPDLHIPTSDNTVTVKIVETTSKIDVPWAQFLKPNLGKLDRIKFPAYAIIIENSRQNKRILFDSGVRKDFAEKAPPPIVDFIKKADFKFDAEKDTHEVLADNGVDLNSIDAIIWSHTHFDHTGNLGGFPKSIDLVVGPGFKEKYLPGYPDKFGPTHEREFEGRNIHEIDFASKSFKLGSLDALDYFGDGSFYLLDTPGHDTGHICGLARTTPDTFILLVGDATHLASELRPSPYRPLPASISSEDLQPPSSISGKDYLAMDSHLSPTKPFQTVRDDPKGPMLNSDPAAATKSVEGLIEFDAQDNVFLLMAHEVGFKDLGNFFPETANNWKELGWKDKLAWRFLQLYEVETKA